ncbi:uncharacterized protein SRS1_10456 [Sporisorium reilianum f. sp. reilianum]|uniref:Uncharacterized protein n=1 Tax=Sporisorium reilianum f. sp. reilianum TaxID=72559 RepID=A0A2N8U8K8_9BASI|nr:uncharacterized protein SRS1_10456 [Sporisorium reilianum f. sp. reilianum]
MAEPPPSPGDDATPFLLKVYVKPAPFRPLDHFRPDAQPARDEFKIYVWKTNTLREVAQLLYDADPTISSPLALHAFRHIYWNDRLREYDAKPVGVGVTRVPLSSVSALLSDLDTADQDMQVDGADQQRDQRPNDESTSKLLGWDLLKDEIDESAASITLADVNLSDGDMLDCVIKPDPSLATAPKQARPTGRDRPSDRFGLSRR